MQKRLALLALSFVGMTWLTGLGTLTSIDHRVFTQFNKLAFDLGDFLASSITLLGDMAITGSIALILAVIGWQRHGLRGLVPLLLFAGVAIEILLKCYLPHPGPAVSRQLWHLPFHFSMDDLNHLINQTLNQSTLFQGILYSFPSGHVFRTTFLAAWVSSRWPRYQLLAWGVIAAMVLTRVYLGEHWLSDVVGGLLLGFLFAAIASMIYRNKNTDLKPIA